MGRVCLLSEASGGKKSLCLNESMVVTFIEVTRVLPLSKRF